MYYGFGLHDGFKTNDSPDEFWFYQNTTTKIDYIFFKNSGVDIYDSRFFVIIIRNKRMVEKFALKCERICTAKIIAVTKRSTWKLNVRRNYSKKRQINRIIVSAYALFSFQALVQSAPLLSNFISSWCCFIVLHFFFVSFMD